MFKYWPMYGAQIAFRNYSPAGGFFGSPWVGLKHFERFINSFQFELLMVNTLTINTLGLLIAFPVPILLALLVNQLAHERFKRA
ncbi:MAG TPA: sugar ABC transporter permease, partial [Propionibacteriaceae bacterium]|nr:sugar ABC transporter permease [Propionibacteriaceae bacterium]